MSNAVLLRVLLAGALLVAAPFCCAWGFMGHRVIATVADEMLTPEARAATQELLQLEPGATLATISTWADEQRNGTSAKWHYVNLPRGTCSYDEVRDCAGGDCVVQAIDDQLAILLSDAQPAKKLQALKYSVHFMADIHQPLHAGHADDKGGNTYQLATVMRGTNLHAFWDWGMMELESKDQDRWVELVRDRVAKLTRVRQSKSDAKTTAAIAAESCQIVSQSSFYPPHKVNSDYVERYRDVLIERLALAAIRLAARLNATSSANRSNGAAIRRK